MSADTPRPFWIIWCPDGPTPPRVKYTSEVEAVSVAEKMALRHPGQVFYVLLTVARSVKRDVHTERFAQPNTGSYDDDEIPF